MKSFIAFALVSLTLAACGDTLIVEKKSDQPDQPNITLPTSDMEVYYMETDTNAMGIFAYDTSGQINPAMFVMPLLSQDPVFKDVLLLETPKQIVPIGQLVDPNQVSPISLAEAHLCEGPMADNCTAQFVANGNILDSLHIGLADHSVYAWRAQTQIP